MHLNTIGSPDSIEKAICDHVWNDMVTIILGIIVDVSVARKITIIFLVNPLSFDGVSYDCLS